MDAKFGSEWGGWHSINILGSHEMGLWKYISWGWRLFLVIPYLIREMGPRLNFGMMCGVETQASRKLSQVYIIWLV